MLRGILQGILQRGSPGWVLWGDPRGGSQRDPPGDPPSGYSGGYSGGTSRRSSGGSSGGILQRDCLGTPSKVVVDSKVGEAG